MTSISFGDFVMDKLLSYSSKMRDSSLKQNGALCLLSDNSNFYPPAVDLLFNNLFGSAAFISDYGAYDSMKETKYESPLVKNLKNNFLRQNMMYDFSPRLFKVVQDNIRFISGQSGMLFPSPSNLGISSVLCDSPLVGDLKMKKNCSNSKLNCCKEVNIVPISKSKLDCDKESDIALISKIKMSVTVKSAPLEETSKMTINNCNKSKSVTLNVQLANRKTKQLQKRSKKRRRRQKRVCQSDVKSTASGSDEADSCAVTSPVSSPVCHSNNTNVKESGVVMAFEQMSPNFMSSFVISVGSVSDDDDSDWDSCSEPGILSEAAEFEFPSLLVTNLSTPTACLYPPYSLVTECKIISYSDDSEEDDEIAKLYADLREVNKKWNESTKGFDTAKSPTKVSFAPDDMLVKVFPVEMYERKGEWETFALERLRFKRRINELEKVLSPCLTEEHRLKVYGKLFQPQL